jgi:inorganic phosphate transporter, PiT family
VGAVAVVAAVGLAFVFGMSDAPNASAALIASRAAPWHTALAFSFALHAAGALLGGTAVALTMTTLVHVSPHHLPWVVASACIAAIVFGAGAARLGIPTSATYGLIGGLVGGALVAGGSIRWGGLHGARPYGVLGALAGIVVSPIVGVAVGWALRRLIVRATTRTTRRMLGPVRGAIWLSAGLVAISDGTNDGQKVMGVGAAALVATGSLQQFEVPLWLRVAVALALALGTTIGGGRVVRRVGRGYYRPGPVDSLAAQASAAGVILGAAGLGAPVSTSTVVAASVVGAGADRHPRHVRWEGVAQTISAWFVTVPACALMGAALVACARLT